MLYESCQLSVCFKMKLYCGMIVFALALELKGPAHSIGNISERSSITNRDDGGYSNDTRLNSYNHGYNNRPTAPWPTSPQADIMFIVPKALRVGDALTVRGNLTSLHHGVFIVQLLGDNNFSPNYESVACQIKLDFDAKNVEVIIVQDGVVNKIDGEHNGIDPSAQFEDTNFEVKFLVTSEYSIDVYLHNGNFLTQINLKHDLHEIRYITVGGSYERVRELLFEFA